VRTGRTIAGLFVATSMLALLVACQPDPTGGARPPAPEATVPPFTSSVRSATRDDVYLSWRDGCPLHWSELRVVGVAYWGYDGARHVGPLVVHRTTTTALVKVFESLYRQRFQIQRIHRVDDYGASDDRSMAANNTSAFNCRKVAGSTRWSKHAWGLAIDINPMQNPYVYNGAYDPPGSERWADRSQVVPGMIVEGGPVVGAFDSIGWAWGGRWGSPLDYQHFEVKTCPSTTTACRRY